MNILAYNVSYKLPTKNYSYTIPVQELRYDLVETSDDDEEDTGPIGYYFLYPYAQPKPPKPKKTEIKNIVNTTNNFSIFIDGSCDTRVTVHSQDTAIDKYKIFVEKINNKTGVKDEFMCLIDRNLLRSLLEF